MKKKIVALCLVVCLLAIAIVGGTLAYFTDTHAQTNTFTAGKVGISLDEAVVVADANGNLVRNGTERTEAAQSYKLYPAQTVTKDPTITVDADSENCYIAAKVTITSGTAGDIETLIPSEGNYMHMLDISKIISGGFAQPNAQFKTNHPLHRDLPVYGTDEYSAYQVPNETGGNGNGEYIIYIFVEGEKTAGYSVALFDTMKIPAEWDNNKMAIMNGTTIKVEAFAAQANGFADCFTAMTTAFPTEFNFSFVTTP